MMTEEVVTFGLWFSPRRLSRLGPYNFSDPLEIQMALLEPFVDSMRSFFFVSFFFLLERKKI